MQCQKNLKYKLDKLPKTTIQDVDKKIKGKQQQQQHTCGGKREIRTVILGPGAPDLADPHTPIRHLQESKQTECVHTHTQTHARKHTAASLTPHRRSHCSEVEYQKKVILSICSQILQCLTFLCHTDNN